MEAAEVSDGGGSGGSSPKRSSRSGSHSGRLLLRMPEGLHSALAEQSEREGTSLNALITGLLAEGIGWRENGRPPKSPRRRQDAPASAPQSVAGRGVGRLLVLNLLVVAAVGIVAVALLVQALR